MATTATDNTELLKPFSPLEIIIFHEILMKILPIQLEHKIISPNTENMLQDLNDYRPPLLYTFLGTLDALSHSFLATGLAT